jgi:membrane-bound inhibitor of C-type lysozyme
VRMFSQMRCAVRLRQLLALLLLAGMTLVTAPPAEAATAKTIKARFGCASDKSIDATFVNGKRSSVNLVLSDGRRLALPHALSGSGARYATDDESVVFWNKGNTAFLEEAGKTTYAECVAVKSKKH